MTHPGWRLAGGMGGIAFVVLAFIAVLWTPLTSPVPEPAFDASPMTWRAYGRAIQGQIVPLQSVLAVAMLGFGVFAAGLAQRLRTAGDGAGPAWTLVLLASAVMIALWMASNGASLAIAFQGRGLDAPSAGSLFGLANGIFATSWFAIGGMLIAAGAGAVGAGALPRWLAWGGVAAGVLFLAAAFFPLASFWIAPYALFYVWVVAVSIVLIRSER